MENYSFKADGEANHYTVFKDENWLMSILHNGEAWVAEQEKNMRVITNSFKLLKAVEEMRELQKQYFNPNTRKVDTLAKSKAKEAEVDKILKAIKTPANQKNLF